MADKNRTIILAIIIGLVALPLCILLALGGFFVGRRSVSAGDGQPTEIIEASTVDAGNSLSETEGDDDGRDSAAGEGTPVAVEPAVQPTTTDESTPDAEDEAPASPTATPPDSGESLGDSQFTEEDLELLWEAWDILRSQYDGQLPADDEITYAIIRGMLEALGDDYTSFWPPDVAARMREDLQGSFEGIGAFVRENEQGLTEIVRPMDGQPADLAGLESGDVVVGVDGESVLEKTLDEVISLIRGPEGTDVTLTVRREGEDPFDVTITRGTIEIPIVESEMREDGVAYVRLTSFSRNAGVQLRDTVDELLEQEPTGLVLDLRDNPGGFLDEAVTIADIFLRDGVVLYERSSTLDANEVYRSDDGDLAESIPLVVLVNAGSASASEIVAGAVQDRDRGILVGETTFGKGSVQLPSTLSDGSELRVTVARWYTPNDNSIGGQGITPDIEVATPEELGGEEDTQLDRAVEYLLTGE